MNAVEKMQAVLNTLSKIPLQERKCLEISAEEAVKKVSKEELEFFYIKLVKGE